MDILSIILTISGFITGGGLVFLINLKSSKRKACAEADEKEMDVFLKKANTLKEIENLNIQRIEDLTTKLDEKIGLILEQKELTMNLKIQLKDMEDKIRNLEKEVEKLSRCNDGLKKENAYIKENMKHFCLDINCKRRERL